MRHYSETTLALDSVKQVKTIVFHLYVESIFLFCCAKLEQHMFIDFQFIEQNPAPNNIV